MAEGQHDDAMDRHDANGQMPQGGKGGKGRAGEARAGRQPRLLIPMPVVVRRILRIVLFPLLFVSLSVLSVIGLQWGVNADSPADGASVTSVSDLFAPQYRQSLRPAQAKADEAIAKARTPQQKRDAQAAARQLRKSAKESGVGTAPGGRMALNVLAAMAIYAVLLALVNRFWVGTGLFASLMIAFAVGERIKVALRSEPVLPTDLQVAAGVAGQVGTFVSSEQVGLIVRAVLLVIVVWGLCVLLRALTGPGRIVWFRNIAARIGLRLVVLALPVSLLLGFVLTVGTYQSRAFRFARAHGDTPEMWSTLLDAQDNGALVSYLRLTHPRVMKRPEGYGQEEMRAISEKYVRQAAQINRSRTTKLTNTTVIGVLSESFSDPTRVPGIALNKDPMPYIRSLEKKTTSGIMLSSGYGGGTANLEFQELTGLSTALLDPTTNSPYLQLVPRWKEGFSFNQLWNEADSAKPASAKDPGSFAVHPYTGHTYRRATNFIQKFLFRYFYTQDGPQRIRHSERIDRSPRIADSEAYQEVLDRIDETAPGATMFVQLSTMQNHSRYENWYDDNEFQARSTTSQPMSASEKIAVQTYAKGVEHTDEATKAWLEQLDKLDRPIIVVWYGDHLPGAYSAEVARPGNTLPMHETDWFIWSNAAARKKGAATKLAVEGIGAEKNADGRIYASPNFLMTLGAQQANAKVSPYMAFLTRMHEQIAAMEPTIATAKNTNWSTIGKVSPTTYLDAAGQQIPQHRLSRSQIRMLHDYQLIEYDMTIGKHYLNGMGFTQLPR